MIPLGETMGAILISVVISAVLYGVSCIQSLFYWSRYEGDRWDLKLLVFSAWSFDTIHQALITHTIYTYLVMDYDEPQMLGDIVWSLRLQVLFSGLTALLVQGFYTLRIWKLSDENICITVLILLLVIGEFACIIAYTAKAIHLHTFVELAELKGLSLTVNTLAAAGDMLIAVTLSVLLHRARTGYKSSDGVINKLIIFTVKSGLLTSVCAICSLVAIVVVPGTFIYIAFYFIMGRLYTNSLLATLNARKILRMRIAGDDFLSALSMQELEGLGAATHNDQVGGLAPAINTASFKGPESDGESTQCGSPSVKVA